MALDSSGISLHKRGYRSIGTQAPINEALAAGMILLTNWNGKSNFIDPMCGSGTFIIEAAMIASNQPPQFLKKDFGFMKWKNFDADMWKHVRANADSKIDKSNISIWGSDQDSDAIWACSKNIRIAGFSDHINLDRGKFEKVTPPTDGGILMMNPPYDERFKVERIKEFYKSIGDRMKKEYAGYKAWIISSNLPAMKAIGLKPFKKHVLFNGPLECWYLGYELYEGSRRK